MKIIYSPCYDGETFMGNQPDIMGVTYVGNMGLLDQLELRAGTHMEPISDVEREAEYHNAMMKHVTGTMFEGAVKVDSFGVAAKLLCWRDALIMAGWNGQCQQPANNKLAVLASIEQDFHTLGIPDCWRNICDAYQQGCAAGIDSVQVDCPWSDIPYLIQKTLLSMEKNGTLVQRMVDEGGDAPTLNVQNIQWVVFEDVNDAYEWFAQIKELPNNTAVINRDNVRLNHTLYTWDCPLVHSSLKDSNPQLLQLFKLSMSIFSRPLNIQNLLSYLMLPMSPIPSMLRRKLARILLKNGGFGEKKVREDGKIRDEWEETMETFEFLGKDGNSSPQAIGQARAAKMPFLLPIRKEYQDGISKEEIIDYIEKLKKWIQGQYADENLPEERKAQLHEINSYLNSFCTILRPLSEKVSFEDIEKLILQVYRPMNYSFQATEAGAHNVIADIRSMAKEADMLIWLDCQDEAQEHDTYDFLSVSEKQELTTQGCIIPDFEQHLKTLRSERIRLLNNCQHIILVQSHFDGTTRLGEHAIVAEARYAFKQNGEKFLTTEATKLFDMLKPDAEFKSVEVLAPVKALELGDIDYPGRKESNTSLDTLINLPFNYVMDYVAKLPTPDDEQLSNPYITTGLVAHHFFEHVTKDADNDLKQMRQLTEKEFEQRLEEAIDATGLILRLPENASSLASFRRQLKESMLAFIDIMEAKQWTPVGCELQFPEKDEDALSLGTIGTFGARIDCLLKQGKQYVIIDFKWSFSKKYGEKLEANTALQLDLYRQAVTKTYPGKSVAGVGYYLMPKKQLLTTDFHEIPQSRLIEWIEPKNTDHLFPKIQNSYKFRMSEIRRGHIEEGETMDFFNDDASYYAQTKTSFLCPLNVTEKYEGRGDNKQVVAAIKNSEQVFKPSKKKTFENDDKEPSEIATSHPILKGRLK